MKNTTDRRNDKSNVWLAEFFTLQNIIAVGGALILGGMAYQSLADSDKALAKLHQVEAEHHAEMHAKETEANENFKREIRESFDKQAEALKKIDRNQRQFYLLIQRLPVCENGNCTPKD